MIKSESYQRRPRKEDPAHPDGWVVLVGDPGKRIEDYTEVAFTNDEETALKTAARRNLESTSRIYRHYDYAQLKALRRAAFAARDDGAFG